MQLLPQLLSGPEADYRLLSGRRKNPRVAFARFSRLRKISETSKELATFISPRGLSSYIKNLQENNKQTRNNSSQFLQSLKASLLAQKSALTVKVNLIILRKATNGTLTRGFPAYVDNIQDVNWLQPQMLISNKETNILLWSSDIGEQKSGLHCTGLAWG